MDIKEFVANFAEQFDETPDSVFAPETNFRDLEEWSSLTVLSVIAMVSDEYDVTIKGDEIRNCNTVNDVFNLVESKQ